MAALFSRVKNWVSGEVLTAAALNAEFNNILNNLIPSQIDDASTNVTAMRATADPGESGSESLSSNLLGEIQRLRFALVEAKGTTYWYETPQANLAGITNSSGEVDTIADGLVTTAKIADNDVTAAKMAANAVGTSILQDGAVTEAKIGSLAVTATKIADGAVTTSKQAVPTYTFATDTTTTATGSGFQVVQGSITVLGTRPVIIFVSGETEMQRSGAGAGAAEVSFELFEDSTSLQTKSLRTTEVPSSNQNKLSFSFMEIRAPSAGSVTYTVDMTTEAGTSNVSTSANIMIWEI